MAKRKRTKQNDETFLADLAKIDPTAKERLAVLAAAMKEKELSAEDVAAKIDVSYHLFMLFMFGRTNLRLETALKLCSLLGLELDQIMQSPKQEEKEEEEGKEHDEQQKILDSVTHVNPGVQDRIGETPSSILTAEEAEELRSEEKPEAIVPGGDEIFGGKLREKRVAAGVTQSALGAACGFNKTPIVEIEKGRAFPTRTMMMKIADELGMTREELDEALSVISLKPEEDEWVPQNEDLQALITICTDYGKTLAYKALWDILQNPVCRKGGSYVPASGE